MSRIVAEEAPARPPASEAEGGEGRRSPPPPPVTAAPTAGTTPSVETRMRVAGLLLGRTPRSIEEADEVLSRQGFALSSPGAR